MTNIFGMSYPLQIIGAIILFVAIYMIYLRLASRVRYKSERHKPVNRPIPERPLAVEAHHFIWAVRKAYCWILTEKAGIGWLVVFSVKRANAPAITDLVEVIVANNSAPLFGVLDHAPILETS